MNPKRIILLANIFGYFCQFLFGRNGIYFYYAQLLINSIFMLVFYLMKDKEMGKAFSLSILVLLLIGPGIVIIGGAIMFTVCLIGGGASLIRH